MNGPKRSATSGRRSVRGCHGPALPDGALRGGFTLVELLIVITIIGILAGLSLGALSSARETARIAKTKSTIAKLNLLVQQHLDSYRTRRVTVYTIDTSTSPPTWIRSKPGNMEPEVAAWVRMRAIRDLMRMEMPERWADFVAVPSDDPPTQASSVPGVFRIKTPSLANRYFRKYDDTRPSGGYDSGECLYMWLTSTNSEAREQFAENEIGDADGDGWPEFQDGWGNPIKFLRWAPAFLGSDIQPVVDPIDDPVFRKAASEADHDPFDPRKLDIDKDPTDPTAPPRGGWRLVPLIYSAGPDRIYGVDHGGTYSFVGNPYFFPDYDSNLTRSDYTVVQVGGPVSEGSTNTIFNGPNETSSDEDYLDNIHNHRAEGN